MRISTRRQITALILALATVLGLNVAAMPVATGAETTACVSELKLKNLPSSTEAKAKTPVILVHGWNGKADDMASLSDSLSSSEALSSYRFDYGAGSSFGDTSNRWVTDGTTAQRLAKTIVCYSRLYGDKDVVIVAHSMGGLLARAALDWAAYGTRAKEVTGHVVTIGTPHEGALGANADASIWFAFCKAPIGIFALTDDIDTLCRQAESGRATVGMSINSGQLTKLPSFPSGIGVRAIAGNVTVRDCAVWGCRSMATGGDLIVSTVSATSQYTSNGNGDGTRTFECQSSALTASLALATIGSTWCDHVGMLSAPQVQADVKESIRQYIASVRQSGSSHGSSASGKPYTMYGMTLRLDPGWDVRGGDSNGWTVKTGDIYAGYYNPTFQIMDVSWLGNQSIADYGDFPECTDSDHSNTAAKLVRQGERPIGNQRASYYTTKLCTDGAARDELFRVWEVKSGGKHLMISTTEWPRYNVTNLDGILANATWN